MPPQSTWRIFRWPAAMMLTTSVGLIAALVGDGVYDLLSWAALGLTLIVTVAAWRGWSAA